MCRDHLGHVRQLFERRNEHFEQFGLQTIEFLGHQVSP